MLPAFDEFGNLPPGIHPATLEELVQRFGAGSPERDIEGQELLEFIGWARLSGVRRSLSTAALSPQKLPPTTLI